MGRSQIGNYPKLCFLMQIIRAVIVDLPAAVQLLSPEKLSNSPTVLTLSL
jgi:hypothetical protein